MDADWIKTMFFWSVVGSLSGLFWPMLIAVWRKYTGDVYPVLTRTFSTSPVMRILIVFVVGILIGGIASALGFTTFLQDPDTRKTLQEQGILGYFAAFSYGFASASLIEEPLKGSKV